MPTSAALLAEFKVNPESPKKLYEHIIAGGSLRSFAEKNNLAVSSVFDWINQDAEISAHYARAKDIRADVIFEELVDISEQAIRAETKVEAAGYRLKIDTLKWQLGKMNKRKYGDHAHIEHSGGLEVTSKEQRDAAVAAALSADK